jgi:hypothetical protein
MGVESIGQSGQEKMREIRRQQALGMGFAGKERAPVVFSPGGDTCGGR